MQEQSDGLPFLLQGKSVEELLHPGTVLYYRLKPKDRPTTPEKEWKGRIEHYIPLEPSHLSVLRVRCLDEEACGEGSEYILAEQVTRIEVQSEETGR